MTESIPETAVVIIGFLGRVRRTIACKSGHIVGKVVITEATVAAGRLGSNARKTEVVLGERNKEMNGVNHSCIPANLRIFRFGNKGSLMVQICMTEKTWADRESGKAL